VEQPPAMCFLDLVGYTRLTEERGDDAAAEIAANLAELTQRAARARGGLPVKWLGDGVMFFFKRPGEAVLAALEMVQEAPATGLPPAHVGIHAGPIVVQDGDYFGRTVNLAARIAGQPKQVRSWSPMRSSPPPSPTGSASRPSDRCGSRGSPDRSGCTLPSRPDAATGRRRMRTTDEGESTSRRAGAAAYRYVGIDAKEPAAQYDGVRGRKELAMAGKFGLDPHRLDDAALERELRYLYATREETFFHGSRQALLNHTERMLQLEREYANRFPERTKADALRTRKGSRAEAGQPTGR
jgi:hypothetical protein